MRCRFCGSTSLHDDTQDKRFSAGKAVAGTIVFGLPGAAAGLIGKKVKGYRCSACGSFMETPMDAFTEVSIDTAIRNAESGRDRSSYDYYKGQYPNIQANLPVQGGAQVTPANIEIPLQIAQPSPDSEETIKRSYRYGLWQPDCPVYVEGIILKSTPTGDKLSLIAWNSSAKTIRSAYFQAKVLDDTGDVVSEVPFVYQGISVQPGMDGKLPENKEFDLKTDLAYKVELTCDKVAFEGDEVWRNEAGTLPFTLPVQPVVDQTNFPRFKYIKTKYSASSGVTQNKSLFMPLKENGYWLCDCGQPVLDGCTCPRCGDTWDALETAFSQKRLQELQQVTVKERAAKRAEEIIKYQESVRVAQEKAKDSCYAEALEMQEKGTSKALYTAAELFKKIPGWKDADERAKACVDRADEIERIATEEAKIAEEKKNEERRIAEEAQRRKNKKIASIVIPLVVIIAAGILFYTQYYIPKQEAIAEELRIKQEEEAAAKKAAEEKAAAEAAARKAAEEKAALEAKKHDWSTVNVGDIKYFGNYEQDNNKSNGSEEIEWVVLAKENGKVLLISKYALDTEPFNDSRADVTWSSSSLRSWLNGSFYGNAFSSEEQLRIQKSAITAESNPRWETSPGKSTEDKVFILSIQEANRYFKSDADRRCEPSPFAKSKGYYNEPNHGGEGFCIWWLRTPGYSGEAVCHVNNDGTIADYGSTVDWEKCSVRPAIWVSY